jgi:hypothetical protein
LIGGAGFVCDPSVQYALAAASLGDTLGKLPITFIAATCENPHVGSPKVRPAH